MIVPADPEDLNTASAGTPPREAQSILLVGARGGLGAAWLRRLRDSLPGGAVFATSRLVSEPLADRAEGLQTDLAAAPGGVPIHPLPLDLEDPASIERLAQAVQERIRVEGLPPLRTVIVASGLLHGPGLAPEKSLRALDAAAMHRLMAVNAIGPALLARQVLPLMPRQGRVVFAAVSARVGSISDNRLGGWYGYRASKAALNQLVRTLAIEWSRTARDSVCVTLHPGTVDTGLSRPFQGNVPQDQLFTPEQSVAHLDAVLRKLEPQHSGRCYAWDGREVLP